MMKLASAEQMRQCDRIAIESYGIAGAVLMENAGLAVVEALERHFGPLAGKTVAIFVGPGNNGGDGLVIARHLHQRRARPQVVLAAPPERLNGDAAANLKIVQELALPLLVAAGEADLPLLEPLLQKSRLLVDALFGTGLGRELGGHYAALVRRLNRFSGPVVAVDVPSGLNSDSGLVMGEAVRADLTVTFGLGKPGLASWPGRELAGTVEVADIGIPPEAVERVAIRREELARATVSAWLPPRPPVSHKGIFGHLLIFAGSLGKSGAAILAAQGALRSGVGLVSAAMPARINPIFCAALTEAMTVPLAGEAAWLGEDDYPTLAAAITDKDALVIGPGLGQEAGTAALVKRLYQEVARPLVVDADALNILAGEPELLGRAAGPRILTPHPGEMARLAGSTVAAVQADRWQAAGRLAEKYGIFVVLKGAGTIIASPDGNLALNPTGNAGMAAGGMGDVLAGLLGGLLCQGLSPWQAAGLAVYLHGLAGDLLAAEQGISFGYLASELAAALPAAFRHLQDVPEKDKTC